MKEYREHPKEISPQHYNHGNGENTHTFKKKKRLGRKLNNFF